MSQFAFLQAEWPAIFEAAGKAEAAVYPDPRTACFYARRALELAVAWVNKHDAALKLPYQDNLSALIHEPSFKVTAGEAVFSKARVINTLGNRAVHSHRAIPADDALMAVRELFHVAYWLARTYGRAGRPAPGLTFDAGTLPKAPPAPRHTAEQLQQLETALRERDEKLAVLLADKSTLDDELKRLRADLAELERMLVESGVGAAENISRAKAASQGFGLFVRSLVGMDREAAKDALAGFLAGKTLGANQIEFVDLIVNHLTEHGVMAAALLYESPFTDLTPRGPDGLFSSTQVDELMVALAAVRATAIAA